MHQTITLIIALDGKTKIETHGFNGPACQQASKFIEEAIGKRSAEQLKTSFFQKNINQHTEYENQ